MKISADLDTRGLERSFADMQRYSKKDASENLISQSSLLVRDVVRITPPNHDGAPNNRRRGEAMVRGDVARAVVASMRRGVTTDAASVHARLRNRDGRVPRNTKPTPARGVPAERKASLARVGWLAAGWNAAAAKLGRSLPAWITRHGTGAGSILIKIGWPFLRVTMINRVGFVGNVRNLTRRIQSALDNRSIQLDKQLAHYLDRAKRRAGFK